MKLANNLQIEQLLKTDWSNQFNKYQLSFINDGLVSNLDVSMYAKPELRSDQMREIVRGLKQGFDMTKYASGDYSESQLRQIVTGLEYGLDVSKFDDVQMSARQMSTAKRFLKFGFDMNVFRKSDLRFEDNVDAERILEITDHLIDYSYERNDEEFDEIFGVIERLCAELRQERAKRTSKK